MNVLLTGASGFIGSHVARTLMEKNHCLTIVAMPGDPLTRLLDLKDHIELIRASLEDTGVVRRAIMALKPDACIHLAWYVEPLHYMHSSENITALTSSLSLFEALRDAGCKRIVGAGTCLEYDTDFGYLREASPARPACLYATAKLACGLLGAQLAGSSKLSFAWGRIFYPYGPKDHPRRLVPSAIDALSRGRIFDATTGEQVRDYIHVTDVASALCLLAENEAGGIFNISSGVPVSVRRVLEILGSLLKRSDLLHFGALPDRPGDPPFICGCNERLKSLGWRTSFTLTAGLADTIRALDWRQPGNES